VNLSSIAKGKKEKEEGRGREERGKKEGGKRGK